MIHKHYASGILLLLLLLLQILTANGGLPGGNGATIRHNTQITHIIQNNTLRSNTAHKTSQKAKDTLHTIQETQELSLQALI
jgi:hypothetical protein